MGDKSKNTEFEVYKMKDLCRKFGVHRNTIINKIKKNSLFKANKGTYKTFYTVEEVEMIKKALSS